MMLRRWPFSSRDSSSGISLMFISHVIFLSYFHPAPHSTAPVRNRPRPDQFLKDLVFTVSQYCGAHCNLAHFRVRLTSRCQTSIFSNCIFRPSFSTKTLCYKRRYIPGSSPRCVWSGLFIQTNISAVASRQSHLPCSYRQESFINKQDASHIQHRRDRLRTAASRL
jgi:hypothetical protein